MQREFIFLSFRVVSEQRKTEEWDFRFWPREKWNESKKMKEGGEGGEGNACRQTPSPLFTRTIFHAFFDSRSLFYAPKLHGNACLAGYL